MKLFPPYSKLEICVLEKLRAPLEVCSKICWWACNYFNTRAELSRNLATLSTQHNETLSAHGSVDHASHIVELDTRKFRIAKAASDLEIESERLEQELKGLRARLHNLDVQGIEGNEHEKARREQDDPTM